MRILMVASPGAGHVFPMVPLAWALRSAGHDVLLATTSFGAVLGPGAGLLTVDVAAGVDIGRVFHPGGAAPDGFGAPRSPEAAREHAVTVFSEVSRIMLDGVRSWTRSWRPDAVVYGSLQAAGAVVAAEIGVPGVEHSISPSAPTGAMISAMWPRLTDAAPVAPVAAIGIVPSSLAPTPSPGWAMRALPYNGGALVPDDLRGAPPRRRVLVTLGTVAPRLGGVAVVRKLIDAVADEPFDIVVALGSDPAELGPLPPQVRAYRWLPLTAALPQCAAIVHHGGAGTTISALSVGVPQVVVPQGADQFLNAAAVERRGCGTQAGPDPAEVRDAVRRAVAGAFDTAVGQVRGEIQELPSPAAVAGALAELLEAR